MFRRHHPAHRTSSSACSCAVFAALALAITTYGESTYSSPYYKVSTLAGLPPSIGSSDGVGSEAQFHSPDAVVVDLAGNAYVADRRNHTIRKITPEGVVTTLAGAPGQDGRVDGSGENARLGSPIGVAIDATGNLYVTEYSGSSIRKITSTGLVTTIAGATNGAGHNDGTVTEAQFNFPHGIAVDGGGNLYIADSFNHTIRKITPAGNVSTLAGSPGEPGSADGLGSLARFHTPSHLIVDPMGNIFVTDPTNHIVRRITPDGLVTTIAGSAGIPGGTDGAGNAARFSYPNGIALDHMGNLYVGSTGSIRKISPSGVVSTVAGTFNIYGSADGAGTSAKFYASSGMAIDHNGDLLIADTGNHSIRKMTPAGVVTTLAGRAGTNLSSDGFRQSARFDRPQGAAVDGAGNVYVVDSNSYTIRKTTAAGAVTTMAGAPGIRGYVDGPGGVARFWRPTDLAVDGSGNLFVSDSNCIRKITPEGVVVPFAGTLGTHGTADGNGTDARFSGILGVALDKAGNVYVADTYNHTLRKITPAGVVSTLAGAAGVSASIDGPVSSARFSYPSGIAVDSIGNVFVTDGNAIRKITPNGNVSTFAGSTLSHGSADGLGPSARFFGPTALAVDQDDNLFVTEGGNRMIRKITPAAQVSTLAGRAGLNGSISGVEGTSDGTADASLFSEPRGIAVDAFGNLYIADSANHTIRKATPARHASPDFNRDGKPDILWQHATTGQRYLWHMNGNTPSSDLPLGVVPVDWDIAATTDLNSDGYFDILWEHRVTGQRHVWYMEGTAVIGDAPLGTIHTDWHMVAAADFNGDGHPDILWEHAVTGQRYLWYMNGAMLVGEANLGTIHADWHMGAAADFNSDGHPDILWEHAVTGLRYLWYMNNAIVIGDIPLTTIHADWHMVAAADFNSDGHPDILWEHAVTGLRYLWYMNGASLIGEANLGTVPADWHIVN